MKKRSLITLIFLPLLSIAQSNYKSGLVVNLKGDTLRGFINFKEWTHNPQNISYKESQTDKARQLGLNDIKYFEISNYARYRQCRVSISLNQVDISSPSSFADTASTTGNVFLRILQQGKSVTLYAYRDDLKERFYIQDGNTEAPNELLYGIYQDPNGSDKIINKNTYQILLQQIVLKYNAGNDKLIEQVQRSNYKAEDLVSIATQINGNIPDQISSKAVNNPPVRFFVGASFISSNLKTGQYYGSPTSRSNSPKISAGVDLITNPDLGHLIFRLELAFAANNFKFANMPNPIFNIVDPETSSIKVKQNVIFITPQIMYNVYNGSFLKVFLDLGYSINIISYPENQVTTFQYGQPIATWQSTRQSGEALNTKSNYSTFQFKAGVVINKRLEIYGAYFPDSNLSNSFNYTDNLSSYQFGINYFFGKTAR